MQTESDLLKLPSYTAFTSSICSLDLPISASELHGIICGYLAAGAVKQGEAYVRALVLKKEEQTARSVTMALFGLLTMTHHQLEQTGFEFQLLLPEDETPLSMRAEAFSEWCEGFTQGITVSGVDYTHAGDHDLEEAIHHLAEFAQLDYAALSVNEEDEKAFMEVIEYARMAVLHIHSGLKRAGAFDQSKELPN